jgi:hypothetical protein
MTLLNIDGWQVLINLLNFIVPALIVFGVTYYIMNSFMLEQRKIRILELKKEQLKELTPIKLQAYERLTLFLDRISPDNLVVRLSKGGQSAAQLRSELIHTVTNEFNHNIAQQIYVSDNSWNMIKAVKEQILVLIETSYQQCDAGETGPGLGKKILNKLIEQKNNPTQRAIELLKKEIEIAL